MKTILITAILLVIAALAGAGCSGEPPAASAVAAGGTDRTQAVPTPLPPTPGTVDQTEHSTVPLGPESDWVPEILKLLPASVADTGVWLSNPIPAMESAGLRPARGSEEWLSWTPEQRQAYEEARAGIPNSGIHYTMTQSYPDWDETFGFGAGDVGAMAETGERQGTGFQVNVLMGEFDANNINRKLLGLGYEGRERLGGAYLTLPEGMKLGWLPQAVLYSNMGNVLALEQAVLTAPTEEAMEELLSVQAGETPSLAEHPAFGDLASTVADPLFMSILNRQAAPGGQTLRSRGVPVEQPVGWGSPSNWEALMTAYSRPSPESQKIVVALWYADIKDAQDSVPELARRFKPVDPSEFPAEWYLQEVCADLWQMGASRAPNGAILAISCQIEAGPSYESLGALLHSALVEGSLGFLLD